jgi:hypothetical protein
MMSLDASPWLLFTLPFLGAAGYVCYRGLARNEFRERGKWGWFTYRTGSLDWYLATLVNLSFLGAALFMAYMSLFHAAAFSR